ncbi:MAG: DUF1993 domain-containing protein [Pseudomonadota bacterium]
MTTPIYKSTIGAMIRQMEAMAGILEKGREHFGLNGIDADAFIDERLHEDMLPFSFQIRSICHSSLGNLEAMRAGQAAPPAGMEVTSYAQLQTLLGDTIEKLKTITADDLDSLLDKDVLFAFGDFKMPFKGLGFLTSFALPNFYFHTITAYNLLRQKGVVIGKGDYLGAIDLNMG